MNLRPIHIGAGLVLLLCVCIFGLYCSASSETNTDKADQHAVNANTAHQESLEAEKQVEVLAEEGKAIEKERIAEEKKYRKSKPGKVDRSEYEKVINEPTVINGDDLDPRERKLLADLKRQFPTFK